MATIQEIVKTLEIPQKRMKAELNRDTITKCDVALSDMALEQKVAMYAYDLNSIQFLLNQNNPENLDEIKRLRDEMHQLAKCKSVREYIFVRSYKDTLEDQISDYYRTIQIDLRDELINQTLPEIYVSQGVASFNPEMQISRHIIIPNTTLAAYDEDFETIIYPAKEPITSARMARHFYNSVSFKYLEQLTQDFSFDLEGKDLGKVKILTRS